MKLVAQRVVSKTSGQGINAFAYSHKGREWLDELPADLGNGELVHRQEQVQPGGNRVRSYLDIVAPDGTPSGNIEIATHSFVRALVEREAPLPWVMAHAGISMEFNLEASLAAGWQIEFRILLAHCLDVACSSSSESRTEKGCISPEMG